MPSQNMEHTHLVLRMRASEMGGSAGLFNDDIERSILWIEGTVDLGLRNKDGVSANEKSRSSQRLT